MQVKNMRAHLKIEAENRKDTQHSLQYKYKIYKKINQVNKMELRIFQNREKAVWETREGGPEI